MDEDQQGGGGGELTVGGLEGGGRNGEFMAKCDIIKQSWYFLPGLQAARASIV